MIDFNKLELVLFDFDDTLCIHSEHTSSQADELSYNVSVITNGKDTYKGHSSRHMLAFMELLKDAGITMGLISATMSYKHAEAKSDWIEMMYGTKMENYCVGTPEDKLTMLMAITKAKGLSRDKILIVDDYWLVLEQAANAGFQACTPMEVVDFIEDFGNQ